MAQIYAHPRKGKLLATLLFSCMLILCAVINSQAQIPTVTSFTPMSGRVGDNVEITGTNFANTTHVYVGNGATTAFEVLEGGTKIRFQVPVTANPGRIRVRKAEGSGYSATNQIFAMPFAPTLTSMSANSGVPGNEITFTGTNLAGVTRVYFGSGSTTGITVISNTQIKATVPATATTARPILQSNEGRVTSGVTFEIVGAPVISSFEPASAAVGDIITIKGTNLEGVTRVSIGSGSTTVFNVEPNGDITVAVPATATSGSVRVQTNSGQATRTGFTLLGGPIVTSISPLQGEAGLTTLTISGENLGDAIRVYIGGSSTTEITVIDNNTISILVPAASYSSGTIRVLTPNGQGTSSQIFEILSSPPVISSFEPTSGPVGTVVTIVGERLLDVTSVSFSGGSTSTFISKTQTEIKVAVPSTAYSGAITVTATTGRHTSSLLYTVEGAPIINSFSPESGNVGSPLTITGQNFLNATRVYVGSGSTTSFSVNPAGTQITLNVPAFSSTGSIRVVTNDGQVTTTGLYTVESAPVITSFSPGSGYIGSPLVIYGQNFTGASRVYVGSGSITNGFTVNATGTEISLNVPSNATTGALRIQASGGQFVSTGTYVVLTPSITLTPNTISFTDVPANSTEVRQYQVSGEGLTNGTPVSLNIGDATSPFTISTASDGVYSRSLDLTGVTNNRLNLTTIYVRYAPLAPTAAGSPQTSSVIHTQGATSRTLTINATAVEPMPVELAFFTAKPKDGNIVFEWRTASEQNNSHFEIEMAVGSLKNFTKVATVASKVGNSSTATNYKHQQRLLTHGHTLYFRLKQVDFDGTSSYSNIVAVETTAQHEQAQPKVVPNPVNSRSKLVLTSNESVKSSIYLSSLAGKRIYSRDVIVLRGPNELALPMIDKLEIGMYILTIELNGKVHQVKIIKQ